MLRQSGSKTFELLPARRARVPGSAECSGSTLRGDHVERDGLGMATAHSPSTGSLGGVRYNDTREATRPLPPLHQ